MLFRRRDRRDELWRKLLNEVQTIGVACRSDTAAATVCVAHSCHHTHTACAPALYVCSYRESAALEVVDTCTEVTTNVRRLTEDIDNAHERYLRSATPTSLSHHCADVNSVLAPAAPLTAAQPTSECVPPLPAPVATLARPRPLAVAQLADNALLSVRRPLRDAQEQVRPPLHRAVAQSHSRAATRTAVRPPHVALDPCTGRTSATSRAPPAQCRLDPRKRSPPGAIAGFAGSLAHEDTRACHCRACGCAGAGCPLPTQLQPCWPGSEAVS